MFCVMRKIKREHLEELERERRCSSVIYEQWDGGRRGGRRYSRRWSSLTQASAPDEEGGEVTGMREGEKVVGTE